MSAYRVPVLRCDGHTRIASCSAEFVGAAGGTFADLRRHAARAGWRRSSAGPDYCPEHAATGALRAS